jgi:hypothetical protein
VDIIKWDVAVSGAKKHLDATVIHGLAWIIIILIALSEARIDQIRPAALRRLRFPPGIGRR